MRILAICPGQGVRGVSRRWDVTSIFTLILAWSLTQIGCVGPGGTCPQSPEETGDCELEASSQSKEGQEEFAAAGTGLCILGDPAPPSLYGVPAQQGLLSALVFVKQSPSTLQTVTFLRMITEKYLCFLLPDKGPRFRGTEIGIRFQSWVVNIKLQGKRLADL